MDVSLVSHAPLASAVVWSAIGMLQARGGSLRVSTGIAFTATAFLMAAFALWDWLSLAFGAFGNVTAAVPPAHFFLVWASLTFFYFAKWLVHGKTWVDAVFAIPAVFVAVHFVVLNVPGGAAAWETTRFLPLWAEGALTHYLLYTLALIVAGIYLLHQGALLTLDAMGRESFAIVGIMGAASLAIAFALLTNPYYPLLHESVTPLYSATLVVPGIALLLALRRGRGVGVLQLFNLREALKGETLAVYLTYKTGDLLGAALSEDTSVDDDIFVGTLDAFQNFFTHALPFFQGQTLKTASFGEISVIIQRGHHCYLTVVTTSKRVGLIRELMMRRLRRFEDDNRAQLEDWSGVVDVLHGTGDVLGGFIAEEKVEEVASR